jgi:hypothetical protein
VFVCERSILIALCRCEQASQGVYGDDSGPEMKKMLLAIASEPDSTSKAPSLGWSLEPVIDHMAIVPDEPGRLTLVCTQSHPLL